MKFKTAQRDSLARAALLDGLILAWEQGLGKSWAAFAWPFLKHARRVLIISPSDLHDQLRETAAQPFGCSLPVIRNAEDLRKWHIDKPLGPLRKGRMPQFFLAGNEALTRNGADEWSPRRDSNNEIIIGHRERKRLIEIHARSVELTKARFAGTKADYRQFMEGVGESKDGITCVWKPSLARTIALLTNLGAGFDCIVIDEATSLQGDSLMSLGLRHLNPKYRLLLTGTPVKNHLESVFYLGWWACGGFNQPTARFPYTEEGKNRFARHHQEIDRFLTREDEWAAKNPTAKNKRIFDRKTPRVCNVHRLWKLLTPFIVRLRKADCGEQIVPCTIRPINIPFGTSQAAVYREHLKNPPLAPAGQPTKPIPAFAAAGMQVSTLRQIALCPDSPALADVVSNAHPGRIKSWTPWTPKLVGILSLVADLLDQGEQITIGSPFKHFSSTLYGLLREAGVETLLLDSRVKPTDRGLWIRSFKSKQIPVLIAGQASMGKGHSLENCSHLVLPTLSWAFDENDQIKHRVWRLNSTREVFIYLMCTEASIEARLAEVYGEKGDSAQLTLDGRLFPDQVEEIDPELLLSNAIERFGSLGETVDETVIENNWPSLAKRLQWSMQRYREFHPPIVEPSVTRRELREALGDSQPDPLMDFAVARQRAKQDFLRKRKRNNQ